MTKWFRNILTVLVLAFLFWYLISHWQQLKVLLNLQPKQLLLLYGLSFLESLSVARVVQSLVGTLGIRTGFWNMAWLHNVSMLLNYAPMKMGTLFRANYLKRHYKLAYSHFAAFFLYIMFLMTAIAAATGLVVLLIVYGISNNESKILAGVFAAGLIGSLCLLFIPLPYPKSNGRLVSALRNFLISRTQIAKQPMGICISLLFLIMSFLLSTFRLWIISRSMGIDIHPVGCLILGALGFIALFLSLTPGSLGIREFVLACGSTVLNVPFKAGLMVALVDRAIAMSYIFIVGGICMIWLWHKSPADFKKQLGPDNSTNTGSID